MKKIFLILIILFLNGCGYTPLYSSKDSNYKVISLNKNVNNSLTNYVQNSIKVISNDNAEKSLNISFEYNENISVILKNSKGDPTKNRLNVVIDLSLFDSNNNLITSKQFSESLLATFKGQRNIGSPQILCLFLPKSLLEPPLAGIILMMS